MSAFDVRDLLRPPGGPAPRPSRARARAMPPAEVLAASGRADAAVAGGAGGLRPGRRIRPVAAFGVGIHQVSTRRDRPARRRATSRPPSASPGSRSSCFQAVGAYRMGAFRSLRRARRCALAGAWSMAFLVVATVMVFAKIADHYSRVWLASFFAGGLGVLILAERFALVRFIAPQMQRGHFDRRTAIVGGGAAAEELIRALEAQAESGMRIVGVFDDRGDMRSADRGGRLPEARHRRATSSTMPAPRASTSSSSRADRGRGAHPADAGQALGAADRHPALGPGLASCGCARAPIPISARCRSSTSSTSRWPTGTSSPRTSSTASSGCDAAGAGAGHARRGARRAPQLARSGPVPAEALRLQQRADRGLQVPLDVRRTRAMPAPPSW